MAEFALKKGLDIPISGSPEQKVFDGNPVSTVALIGADYNGLKPRMLVSEGDEVRRGTPLFCHKDNPEVMFVSPATGRVAAINRGARRVLQSVVVEISDIDDTGVDFGSESERELHAEEPDVIRQKLQASGLWTAFRTRPYSKVPPADQTPAAIFVTAIDTEPLCPDPAVVLAGQNEAFEAGLIALTHLTKGSVYLCRAAGSNIHGGKIPGVDTNEFSGPHPAGLAGTHMHFLEPPGSEKTVWSIGYQDVLAVGHLFLTGHLDVTRVVSVAGPRELKPRLIRTVMGASITDLVDHESEGYPKVRVISGSVLSGGTAAGPFAYLGRYARQITIITEDREQSVLGWITPQGGKYAVQPVLASARKKKLFGLTSNMNGGRRAMVPTGTFEELMPQDYLPTQLLRALIVLDTDSAQALGALELDEEDVALCAFACPAKYEYGQALRDSLEKIETEG